MESESESDSGNGNKPYEAAVEENLQIVCKHEVDSIRNFKKSRLTVGLMLMSIIMNRNRSDESVALTKLLVTFSANKLVTYHTEKNLNTNVFLMYQNSIN